MSQWDAGLEHFRIEGVTEGMEIEPSPFRIDLLNSGFGQPAIEPIVGRHRWEDPVLRIMSRVGRQAA
ncbi:MAG: hypothetical protein QM754_18220 [Tepidisphaeraceae bacterium]